MAKQQDINKIKDRAVPSAKETSCVNILKEAGYPLVRGTGSRSSQIYSVCPICGKGSDISAGRVKKDKFSITQNKNNWYCFGCGKGGGAPKLYSILYNVEYIEACLILACKNGDITQEEFNKATTSCDARKKLKSDTKIYQKIEEVEAESKEFIAPVKTVDLVYRHMLSLPSFKLSDEHRKYLKEKRGYEDAEIDEIGFFSYLSNFSIDTLVENIRKEAPKFTHNNLCGVAGFFFVYSNKAKTMGKWCFKSPYPDCLGIPLRNYEGKIMALQLRYLGDRPTDNKYFYVSSKGQAVKGKETGYGVSCGTPVSTFYPKELKNANIFIGEGFFKMREVSKEGSIALSIQGVNSIKDVATEINNLISSKILIEKARNLSYESRKFRLIIVFDMDMFRKTQVLEAGIKFSNYLKKHYPNKDISFLIWNEKLGKGFDDMKFYCQKAGIDYRKSIGLINSETFCSEVEQAYMICDNKYINSSVHKEDGLRSDDTKIRRTDYYSELLFDELYNNRLKVYFNQ